MSNDFYNASGNPSARSNLSSQNMRVEFASVATGFGKLPALTGNGGRIAKIKNDATAMEASSVLFDDGSSVTVGASATRSIGGVTQRFYVESTDAAGRQGAGNVHNSTTAGGEGASLALGRSRGSALSAVTAVAANDGLGQIKVFGADGTSLTKAATIEVYADGTVSTGVVPGRISFKAADASGVLTETARATGSEFRFSKAKALDGTSAIQFHVEPTLTTGDPLYKSLQDALAGTGSGQGAPLVGYMQDGANSVGTTVDAKLDSIISILDKGAVLDGSTDDSSAANKQITDHNILHIPAGSTAVLKNIELFDNTQVIIHGKVKLPSGCSDFDRMFYAANKTGIRIYINEIDGNYAGQSGNIGTHLIYLTGCTAPHVWVDYIHDHYIASGAPMTSVDGIRNTSSGPVFLQAATGGRVHVGRLENWGREGIYVLDSTGVEASVSRAVVGVNNTEYSGIQVGGSFNKILHAYVEGSNGSGVGFDTADGVMTNVVVRNCRAQQGVNFGHPGRPASRSVASNIIVDGCYGNGIGIQSSSEDVVVSNFHVRNAGGYGISTSDSSTTSRFSNGVVENSGLANVNAAATEVTLANVDTAAKDVVMLTATTVSGTFTEGETVTASGGGSGTLRKYISNLTGAERKYFLSAGSGTWTGTLTGGTSGATATITASSTPAEFSELTGGLVVVTGGRYHTGSSGNQVRFPDGTAIYTHTVSAAFTAVTLGTITITYGSNVVWASAPVCSVTVSSAVSTSGYADQQLRATSTTSAMTISAKFDVTQTHGFNVLAVGRWK